MPGCRCLRQLRQDGLQLSQLFTAITLSEEERAALLKAVVKVEPTFSPPPPPPPQLNTSTLLQGVYAKVSQAAGNPGPVLSLPCP